MEVRCHTPPTADPVLAVADSEGGINLVRWSTSEVFLSGTNRRRFVQYLEAPSDTVPENYMRFDGHALSILRLG